MTDHEAIAEFGRWLAHLDEQRARTEEMQRLARLAKDRPAEAMEGMRQLDRAPLVYDGARLEPAVRHACRRLKALIDESSES